MISSTLNGLKISDGKVEEDYLGLGSTPEPFVLAEGQHVQDAAAKAFLERLPPKYRNYPNTTPLTSVQEVEAYGLALAPLIGEGKATTLSCYMGGETKDKGAFDGESYLNDVEELQSDCVRTDGSGNILTPTADRNPGAALLELRKKSPWVHRRVVDKVYARAVSKQTSLDKNIDQEVAAFYKKVGNTIASAVSMTPWLIGGALVVYLFLRFGAKK